MTVTNFSLEQGMHDMRVELEITVPPPRPGEPNDPRDPGFKDYVEQEVKDFLGRRHDLDGTHAAMYDAAANGVVTDVETSVRPGEPVTHRVTLASQTYAGMRTITTDHANPGDVFVRAGDRWSQVGKLQSVDFEHRMPTGQLPPLERLDAEVADVRRAGVG